MPTAARRARERAVQAIADQVRVLDEARARREAENRPAAWPRYAEVVDELRDLAAAYLRDGRRSHLAEMRAQYAQLAHLGGNARALEVTPAHLGIARAWFDYLAQRHEPMAEIPKGELPPVAPLPSIDEAVKKLPKQTVFHYKGGRVTQYGPAPETNDQFLARMRRKELARRRREYFRDLARKS